MWISAGLSVLVVASGATSSSGHARMDKEKTHTSTVLLVDRNGQRILTRKDRRVLHDNDLPLPHSIHELGQHRVRTHEFERTAHILRRRRQLEDEDLSYVGDGDIPTNASRIPMDAEITPLYPGYGTHFSYVWVGTPPQRQSVIIDTGSHYTAFPCTGCSQCGQHTDSYWDMKNSSTMNIPKCNNQPCVISQSYSEGSSWKAIKVIDKLWVGGLVDSDVTGAMDYTVDFLFGCQTSETGLFRTQLADGIMGMSMDKDTLPFQLKKQHATSTKVFALCFRVGGGIMTLGGVEQKIHSKPGISYAKLLSKDGWFQVNLLDIALVDQSLSGNGDKELSGKDAKSLSFPASKYNGGKGTIVDSGTTDTYFPSSFADKFSSLFKDLSGVKFSSGNVALSSADLARMPNIVFTFEGTDGKPFTILMPWTNYVDSVGGGKYAFRIYLTEGSGIVLGANFMTGMNVIFDPPNKDSTDNVDGRVGFAKSTCKYEEFEDPRTLSPTASPSHHKRTKAPSVDSGSDTSNGSEEEEVIVNDCEPEQVPLSECSAECATSTGPYIATGNQTFTDTCGKEGNSYSQYCHVSCNGLKPVRGIDPACADKPWTECNHACLQSRMVPAILSRHHHQRRSLDGSTEAPPPGTGTTSTTSNQCKMTQQTRVCYTGACPVDDGDYLVFIDLRVFISPQHWSYVHAEAFYGALSKMFNVREANIELLNDASSEYTLGVKLHFQIRIKAKDFPSVQALHNAAQAIPEAIWQPDFKGALVSALDAVSKRIDKIDYSRYGYMESRDIEVLNAMALPIGDVRDPVTVPLDPDGEVVINHIRAIIGGTEQLELILMGVALACIMVMCCVCAMHYRLRQEHAALEKDKIMGGSLRRMWNRFMKQERLKNAQRYNKVELGEVGEGGNAGAGEGKTIPFSADADVDDELDEEDELDMH